MSLWGRFGWGHVGVTLGWVCVTLGSVWGNFGVGLGTVLGPFWDRLLAFVWGVVCVGWLRLLVLLAFVGIACVC